MSDEKVLLVNEKYIELFGEILEKLKYHDELAGPLESDYKNINESLLENNKYILYFITDNFLYCLESVSDHNSDYFTYQKDKIKKKNGKFYKNKISKIGDRTLFKKILLETDSEFSKKIFNKIVEIFKILTEKDENDVIIFNKTYSEYVKDIMTENKNYSKMLMVMDNANSILEVVEVVEELEINKDETMVLTKTKKNKKSKGTSGGLAGLLGSLGKGGKGGKGDGLGGLGNLMGALGGTGGLGGGLGEDFIKGLENTKIAQLAKSISEKLNIDDFPLLSDPSKLLSSLGNPGEEGGIQNLLKFVMSEVEESFKGDKLNEKDLIGEAQNIMGQFKNMSGIDPESILKNNDLASIFSKMK